MFLPITVIDKSPPLQLKRTKTRKTNQPPRTSRPTSYVNDVLFHAPSCKII